MINEKWVTWDGYVAPLDASKVAEGAARYCGRDADWQRRVYEQILIGETLNDASTYATKVEQAIKILADVEALNPNA